MNQFTALHTYHRAILEKRAEDYMKSITPDYGKDSQEVAVREVDENRHERRKELEYLLSGTKKEEKDDTKSVDKALDAADKDSTDTSNPLLKIAMNRGFFQGLRDTDLLKTASADYMNLVYSAFQDEMQKIAGAADLFSMKGVGNMIGKGKAVAGKAMAHKPPPIPAAAMKPKAWGPGTVIGDYTSIANNATPVVPGRGSFV